MLSYHDRIITGCLNGGFLSVLIAWHMDIYHKVGVLSAPALMWLAGVLWSVAAGWLLWNKRNTILQQEVRGWTLLYLMFPAVPLCLYASLMPWALLQMLCVIYSPVA